MAEHSSSKTIIKVLVVDDSAVVRHSMRTILSADKKIKVIGVASDPYIAANMMKIESPDVIVLDVEMPRMDGITFLKKIMTQHPIPVVICSGKAPRGSLNALQALEFGAVEIIEKPKLGTKQFIEESRVRICDAVKAAHCTALKEVTPDFQLDIQPKLTADAIIPKPPAVVHIETTDKIAVVGASTGGTEALRSFLESLPLDAPGIVIVQHMPEYFTKAFARRLDASCKVSVKEAEQNDTVIRGRALIAPGNHHLLLRRSGARYYTEIKDGPLVSRHRPSVDVLFRSAARFAGKNAVGVIMTGMGDDGAKGMREMKDAGAYTIAQNEKSCVVFGMPREAIKLGAVDEVVPLKHIAGLVIKACGT
jgi:two-component system chemotaxis response regulator CheB